MSRARLFLALVLTCLVPTAAAAQSRAALEVSFRAWLTETAWPAAQQAGVSHAVFDRATAGLTLDWSLPDLAPPGTPPSDKQWQAEFASPGRYLAASRLNALQGTGRAMLTEWSRTLSRIEGETGVPREIIVAIWGIESSFGRAAIPESALQVLATQAYIGARKATFLPEFIAALQILEDGHIKQSELKSSVAGALGQPQFLPSKFLAYAVDFNGDGKRDIWTSVPDTLGSIGNYLRAHGWRAGEHWGAEASIPQDVSCALEGPEQGRPLSEWQRVGIERIDGAQLEGAAGETRYMMMPAGRLGPAFIVSTNFYVIKTYNESDLYALFVGHLADRLARDSRIQGEWQTVAGFSRGDVRRMQQRLVQQGHDVGGADGLVGFKTRIAVGLWQAQNGQEPTCFPDNDLIGALR